MKSVLSIGWWNTSCNPYGGSSCIPFSKILKGLVYLLKRCDVLALGEFDQSRALSHSICTINQRLKSNFVVKPLKTSSGGAEYKNCILYRKGVLGGCKVLAKSLFKPKCRGLIKNYRIGQRLRLSFVKNRFNLDLYLVHWRPTHDQDKNFRRIAADTLSDEVSASVRRVVCIGDFNLEPQDDIMKSLLATRSRTLACNEKMLFNPAWSFLGEGQGTLCVEEIAKEIFTPELAVDQALVNAEILDVFDVKCCVVKQIDGHQQGHHHPIILKLKEK